MSKATIAAILQSGIAHHRAGHLPQAEAFYHEVLIQDPNCADALHLIGVIALQSGRHELAVDLIAQAIALSPKCADYHSNLGATLRKLSRFEDAATSLRHALALRSEFPAALNNLGDVLVAQHQTDEALVYFRQALRLDPNFADAHYNLGNASKERGLFAEAEAAYRQAVAIKPDFAEAYNNLSIVLRIRHQIDYAAAASRHAISLKPHYAEAHNNLGNILKDQGQLDEAAALYRRAVELKPDYSEAHSNLIMALYYRSGHDTEVVDAELRCWNRQYGQRVTVTPRYHSNRLPYRRLRIGYLSPDFRSHPVGRFLLPLFAHHSRQSFEIFCYSNTQSVDHLTAWFRSAADGWRDIANLSDQQAADLILEDRIDILVDLALHTAKSRLSILALKPALVQATYLAYPGYTGLGTVDFRITDPYLDPPDSPGSHGNEQPIRLQGTYWCYQPTDCALLDVGTLPALATGRITFGCLNNFCKATPETLAVWCVLLQAVPDARLRLHVRPGTHRARVLDFFATRSIDPKRLDFMGFVSEAEYFQSYRSIDIALDPFPFPGGTTTCDALWMGVPVISLAGPTPVTRGGQSLLCNVGLPELVADSVDDYIAKATVLARDLPRLVALRVGLREQMQRSPLMDAPLFARNIESAYRTMWQKWCARQNVA